jgi:arabinofuranan 3-O-arabinosyltransferase
MKGQLKAPTNGRGRVQLAHGRHELDRPPGAPKPDHGRWASLTGRGTARQRALAYFIPTLLALLAVQTWFPAGTVIATSDLPPPIAPAADYRSHWNQFTTGEGAPSFEITALPYFEGLRGADRLGLGEAAFQRIWLSGLFAGSAAALVFFAFSLLRSPLAAGTVGLLGTFNAYHLLTGPDAIPLVAAICALVLGGLVVRAGDAKGGVERVASFTLFSLGLGFVFSNPPHVALVGIWLAASVALAGTRGGLRAVKRALVFVGTCMPLVILVNLWWIVPAVLTILEPSYADRFAAGDAEAWSWTHRRASLANAFTLNTSWAWTPEYFPYTARLGREPFDVLRFSLPALAGMGLLLARGRERRLALALAGIALVLAWVAKGLHEPFPEVNLWLYHHLPGFWLFRDPGKALLLLTIALSLLAGIAIARITGPIRWQVPAWTVVAILVGGAVAYAHPLFTGEAVPGARPQLPSTHVRVPDAWRAVGRFLDREQDDGKVLVLPRPDFYQLPTTWGYYGVSFSRFVLHRPVLEPQADGYFQATRGTAAIVDSIQRALLAGHGESVTGGLRALGVRYVLLRRDLDRRFPGRNLASASALAAGLTSVPGLEHVRSFEILDLFRLRSPGAEVFPAQPAVYEGPPALLPDVTAGMPRGAALLTDSKARLALDRPSLRVFRFEPDQVWRLRVKTADDTLRIRLSDPAPAFWSDLPSAAPPREILVPKVRLPAMLTTDGGSYRLETPSPTWISPGALSTARFGLLRIWTRAEPDEFDLARALPPGDCHRYDNRGAREVGIRGRLLREAGDAVLRLAARDHAACVALPIESFHPGSLYRLRLDYHGLAGSPPRVCLWQEGPDRCAPLPTLAASATWRQLETTVTPPAGTTRLTLFLYADGNARETTITEYRRLRVATVPPVALIGIAADSLPRIEARRLGPAEFRARVIAAKAPFLLVLAESYASGWQLERPGASSAGVRHLPVNGYANAWLVPWTGTYEVRIQYSPERIAKAGRRVGLVAVLALLGSLGLLRLRRSRPSWPALRQWSR